MIELRPQPVGIFPPPAANLLLPAVDDDRGALQALLQGSLEVELPTEWEFFAAAARGEIQQASDLLGDASSPIAKYNRFVLQPSPETYAEVARSCTPCPETSVHGVQLRATLDVAAYAAGITDAIESDFPLDGELLALALATSAAFDLEQKKPSDAAGKIKQAMSAASSASPLLTAILTAQHADIMVTTPGLAPALASNAYREAIRLAGECRLPLLVAELHVKLGMVFQNAANGQRGALLEAVNAYQTALQNGITEEAHPEMFAQLQNNLGLAYLSMPAMESSNQLRSGIAVQSFRHALKVYTPEKHPDMWASISMNLANALVYAPSSHPEDNLIQAVETYENVLQVRSRAKDPVAYALVLLNQANALAHLGIFKPALEKLAEAYKLFHWYEQIEQANAARELVEQINERMGDQGEPAELTTN